MDTPANSQAHARADWEERIGQRSQDQAQVGGATQHATTLPPPGNLTAEPGAGQVTLHWQLVAGAVGYNVHRSESPSGPFAPIDHGGGDVLAVPGPFYADTTGVPGTCYWYAIASIADANSPPGKLSAPIEASPGMENAKPLTLRIQSETAAGQLNPVWHMLGTEHLSQLFYDEGPGGSQIGAEFEAALKLARSELGATHIRAHAILDDEQGVYREVAGEASYDFTSIDRIYDRLLELGLRPIIELSFMPRDLASNPASTVFWYQGINSPPRDWQRWGELNRHLAAHLVERYGIEEVSQWGFEIWNEPNLKVFWTGTQADYFRLYELAARAIKSVDERLQVGGPSSAASEWIADFLDFARREAVPLDFLSTHTYGNMPLDIKQTLEANGFEAIKIWWTEWGVTPTHSASVNDSAFGAPFILHGMKSVQGRADALAYWVISDHFEELGRAPRLLHGGFGLLTIGNLRKPRYWALALAEDMGTDLVQCEMQGDGAGSLVDVWASRKPDGSLHILVWNGTLDQSKLQGDPLLNRRIEVRIEQLVESTYQCSLARVDALHSNIATHWQGETPWPTPELWEKLHASDTLDEHPLPNIVPHNGTAHIDFDIPMPGIVRLRLIPV
jgi:xylan 1,4-beta-xylosidase